MIRVDFSFNEPLLNQNGLTLPQIYGVIKKAFDKGLISCAREDTVLSFEAPDTEYGRMMGIAGLFCEKEWVLKYATSFLWWEDDAWEDWLSQAKSLQNAGA